MSRVSVEWINCNERRPITDRRVLFLPTQGFGAMQLGWWERETNSWSNGHQTWQPENVTHWALLPPLPLERM